MTLSAKRRGGTTFTMVIFLLLLISTGFMYYFFQKSRALERELTEWRTGGKAAGEAVEEPESPQNVAGYVSAMRNKIMGIAETPVPAASPAAGGDAAAAPPAGLEHVLTQPSMPLQEGVPGGQVAHTNPAAPLVPAPTPAADVAVGTPGPASLPIQLSSSARTPAAEVQELVPSSAEPKEEMARVLDEPLPAPGAAPDPFEEEAAVEAVPAQQLEVLPTPDLVPSSNRTVSSRDDAEDPPKREPRRSESSRRTSSVSKPAPKKTPASKARIKSMYDLQ